jgi:hypothetical protein
VIIVLFDSEVLMERRCLLSASSLQHQLPATSYLQSANPQFRFAGSW